ncbi:Ig-like domain-containing protein, partial [Verrucomicrobiota bacterium]
MSIITRKNCIRMLSVLSVCLVTVSTQASSGRLYYDGSGRLWREYTIVHSGSTTNLLRMSAFMGRSMPIRGMTHYAYHGRYDEKLNECTYSNFLAETDVHYANMTPQNLLDQAVIVTGRKELEHACTVVQGLSAGGRAAANSARANKPRAIAVMMDHSSTDTSHPLTYPEPVPDVPMLLHASYTDDHQGINRRVNQRRWCQQAFQNVNQAATAFIHINPHGHTQCGIRDFHVAWLRDVLYTRVPLNISTNGDPYSLVVMDVAGMSSGGAIDNNIASEADGSADGFRNYHTDIDIRHWTNWAAPQNQWAWIPGRESAQMYVSWAVSNGASITSNGVSSIPDVTPPPTNWAPAAFDDEIRVPSGAAMYSNAAPGVLTNDVDVELDAMSAVIYQLPSNGTFVLYGDGSFEYTPTNGAGWGTDVFEYMASDSNNSGIEATVTLVENIPPVASNDNYVIARNVTNSFNAPGVLVNDFDSNSDPLTASLASNAVNGVLNLSADGSFTYYPDTYTGPDGFSYWVSDGLDSNLAQVVLFVTNTAPIAIADEYVVNRNTQLSHSVPGVLGNDTEPSGEPMTAVIETTTSSGTLALNTNGSFIYDPDFGFAGMDSFTYRAYDGELYSPVATAVVQVLYPSEFKVHRGSFTQEIGTAIITLSNNVDYTLSPDSSTSNAFIRLVNTYHSGGGSATGATHYSRRHEVWINNPGNLTDSVDFRRYQSTDSCAVSWELIEYMGITNGPNEIIVRDQARITLVNGSDTMIGAAVNSISDTNRVVVFVTGAGINRPSNEPQAMALISEMNSSKQPVFKRSSNRAGSLSYAIVEFTGFKWSDVQRVEHSITNVGNDEVEVITPVATNSTFMHVQARAGNRLNIGAQVWFSDTNKLTFRREVGANGHPLVAWIVENTETNPLCGMNVQHIKNTRAANSQSPYEWTESINAVSSISNVSIMSESSFCANERPINLELTDTSQVTLWDTGTAITNYPSYYTFSVVEWPRVPFVDTDGDWISDGDETNIYGTNPGDPDSDDDGMPDGWEVVNSSSATNSNASADADGDGLSNFGEYAGGTDPNDTNSIFKIIKHSGHDADEFGSLVQALSSDAESKLMWLGGTNGSTN